MKKSNIAIVSFLAGACIFASCQKNDAEASAPVLPPVESIMPDLSSFNPVTKADADSRNEYFAYVADYVINNWQKVFEQVINIPVQGFQAFVDIHPVYQGNGMWLWQCDVRDGFTTYTVSLVGKVKRNSMVEWELAVSSKGLITLKNFVWLTGESTKDGLKGNWKVSVGPTDLISPTDVIVTSEWECNSAKEVQKVDLTYALGHMCCGINPFFHNSTISYMAYATDDAYDHSVSAYYNHMGLGWWKADAEWNASNGSGQVRCSSKWGDSDWHKWPATVSE